jgi:EmrB/QacA subfamily drug resistance transporter
MINVKEAHYKWLVLTTVSIGTFVGSLDGSITNISYPRLTEIFNTDSSVILWISVVYLLISVSLMLSFGRLGDIIGRKRIFIAGLSVFTVGLLLCSISQTIVQLLLARVVQGIGTAMSMGLGIAIVTAVFPNQQRGRALGIFGAVFSSGLLVGPILGGFLLDTLGWQSIFYTRVPVGLIALVMAWLFIKEQKISAERVKFDIWGAATLFGSLASLLLFVNIGGMGGFISLTTGLLALCFIVLFILFIIIERRTAQPTIDLNLFKNLHFASGTFSMIVMSMSMSAVIFLLPFYLIQSLGYTALMAALTFAVIPLTIFIICPPAGWITDRIGPGVLRVLSSSIICLSFFFLSRLGSEATLANIAVRAFFIGIGLGLFDPSSTTYIMGSVPPDRFGTASAMINTTRQMGLAIGTAIAGTVFAARQLFHEAQLANTILDPEILHRLSSLGGFKDALFISSAIAIAAIIASIPSLRINKK